jgi:predicted nucleic acid-binding protein
MGLARRTLRQVIVVDKSVLIGSLLTTDAHFQESAEWGRRWFERNYDAHFPMLVLPELAGVLTRSGTPTQRVVNAVAAIVDRPTLHLHEQDFTNSLLAARVATATGLKGADAVFVALAAWLDLPLVSWDKQQRERGATFCRTMTPVEAMGVNG